MGILQNHKNPYHRTIVNELSRIGKGSSIIEELEEHMKDDTLYIIRGITNTGSKYAISILGKSEQVARKGISLSIRKRLLPDNICICEQKKQYLYDLSHLVAPRFGGNNKEENLFIGTQKLNQEIMRDVENQITDYLTDSINKGNHVLYLLELDYRDNDRICSEIKMRAYSIENDGLFIEECFENSQPNYQINYADGTAQLTNNN